MFDNLELYDIHEFWQERGLERLPTCCMCGEHIQQEDAVRINGEWFCDGCLNTQREEVLW